LAPGHRKEKRQDRQDSNREPKIGGQGKHRLGRNFEGAEGRNVSALILPEDGCQEPHMAVILSGFRPQFF
jgi:hypothetical protein